MYESMKESYFWHKLHSLTGVIPTGFYLVQHLVLNTFSLGGPEKFNGVIGFFEGMPKHFLYLLKFGVIWPALIFHAVYGIFIVSRASENYTNSSMKYRENRYYFLQRATGIFAFIFLCVHMGSTSVVGQLQGAEAIYYETWAARLSAGGYLSLLFYVLGIAACAYHFAYGIWNFCIRWGITVSEKAQASMGKFSAGAFVAITALGIIALFGFFNPILQTSEETHVQAPAPGRTISNSAP